jgi:hypothetical protein
VRSSAAAHVMAGIRVPSGYKSGSSQAGVLSPSSPQPFCSYCPWPLLFRISSLRKYVAAGNVATF